eukprot:TRINITY_DN8602_c0_g1_i4.p1 TRINITY_DN8602_c0_g1~~TRINITY_DN8602_c0_g1_i4.p1  ORF type:complete len:263 (-),score=28.06 TRINITY_DN8602_c0_g1_i4:657-1445(-)
MRNGCSLMWKPLIPLLLLWFNSLLLYFVEREYKLLHLPVLLLQTTCFHLPPLISITLLIIGTLHCHIANWIKNDYSFYEETKLSKESAIKSTFANLVANTPNDSVIIQGSFCPFPKTFNDWKILSNLGAICIVLHIILVGIVIGSVLCIDCPPWVAVTFILWFFAVWFGVIGACTYVNGLYQISFLSVVSMTVSVLLPIFWALLIILCPYCTISPGPMGKFVIVTIASLYMAGFQFFLALYMVFDMFLALKKKILVHLSLCL